MLASPDAATDNANPHDRDNQGSTKHRPMTATDAPGLTLALLNTAPAPVTIALNVVSPSWMVVEMS